MKILAGYINYWLNIRMCADKNPTRPLHSLTKNATLRQFIQLNMAINIFIDTETTTLLVHLLDKGETYDI